MVNLIENNLLIARPDISSEWHPIKNGDLKPSDFKQFSGKKVWWLCKKGHEWLVSINDRNRHNTGCPYCAGKKADEFINLQVKFPELANEWHPTKNGKLLPINFRPYSNKKVWWLCKKGHEWKAIINNRSSGINCPYCSNQKVSDDNSLEKVNPQLAKEWHPTKNNNLLPKDVVFGSEIKVWWLCIKGHEWKAAVKKRHIGQKCPYCLNKKVCHDNCLETINVNLSSEWHPTKNGKLKPSDVTASTNKKVWWLCKKGHEWRASVVNRNNGTNCPYCSGNKVSNDNSLRTINPILAKEWHPTKNSITPDEVTSNSGLFAWWLCSKGHEWKARIYSRNSRTGCPYCTNQKPTDSTSLLSIYPYLAKEWHPTKNGNLKPSDFLAKSNKSAWWICKRKHVWKAKINNRAHGNNCPYCNSQSSQVELRVYTELKALFNDVKHRFKIDNVEIDVFIPSLMLGIEIDGFYWHKNKFELEKGKNTFISNKNVKLIRLRDKNLTKTSDNDIDFLSAKFKFETIKLLIEKIIEISNLEPLCIDKLRTYINNGKFINENEFRNLIYILPSPTIEKSLSTLKPEIAKEWHPTKNGDLKPEDVTPGSNMYIWWICNKGHEWKAVVRSRDAGTKCPYCMKKYAHKDYNLELLSPETSRYWHPTKNGDLKPNQVSPQSGINIWWLCPKGHEYQAKICNMLKRKTKCLHCEKQKSKTTK